MRTEAFVALASVAIVGAIITLGLTILDRSIQRYFVANPTLSAVRPAIEEQALPSHSSAFSL